MKHNAFKYTLYSLVGALLLLGTGCTAVPTAAAPQAQQELVEQLEQMTDEVSALRQEVADLKAQQQEQPQQEQPVEQPQPEAEAAAAVVTPEPKPALTPIPAKEVKQSADQPAEPVKSVGDYGVDALAAEVAAAVKRANDTAPAATREENRALYRDVEKAMDALDRKLDQAEDRAEQDVRNGKLSRADYKEVERQLEKLENDLDRAEDALERRLGLDD